MRLDRLGDEFAQWLLTFLAAANEAVKKPGFHARHFG
jgi:hypothetical protein